ncbi:M12 family metallopeptidase [Elizabethkingia meningoseptica]|uniref:M12 family metallopeptidase n=1 Tax=Elizabethkingia meningoseptica TaxID=238 RepID=UPI0023B0BFE9|nr:M12 family metallopeptidase [Elizabethkingia meningoseptica]MDE5430706.1 RICIN domain-containing protein [Elizabethkingia meningoseptica]
MKRKLLTLSGCLILLLNSCKSEIEQNTEGSPGQLAQLDNTTIHKLVINGNDTYVNETDGKYFFADDVIISPEQFNYLKKLSITGTSTIERSTIAKSFARTWPNGVIYYRIPDQGSLSNQAYDMFKRNLDIAFNMISSRTNIEFVERTNQAEYLHFQSASSIVGNNSPLGWRGDEAYNGSLHNTINIYNYNIPAIIAHEIMHSMGIMHEQCRPDRDQYMIVNTSRADQRALINFNIDPTMSGYGDFDFGSVMMYGPTDFAIDPSRPVMTRLDGSLFTKQRNNLSDGDYAGINHLYGPVNSGNEGTYNIESALASNINLMPQVDANDQNKINIVISTGTINNNQRFILRKSAEHGYYTIRSVEDATKVLTISGTSNGSVVESRRNKQGDDQKWTLYNLGNDGYGFAPKNAANLRMEVRNSQTANGTFIIINTNLANSTTGTLPAQQRFKLNRVNN